MRVAVIGMGAIGSLITYSLNLSKLKPYLVFRSRDLAKKYSETGIEIKVGNKISKLDGYFIGYEELPKELDISFICVKSYDFSEAMNKLIRYSRSKLVITCQNGLGSFELASKLISKGYVAALVLNVGVYRLKNNLFEYVGGSTSYIGSSIGTYSRVKDILLKVVDILGKVFKVEVVPNITPYRWYKLLINAGINPITALLRAPNSIILSNDYAKELAINAVKEGINICNVLNIKLPKDPISGMLEVAKATANNYSSMLQDLMRGRRTEIDYINGKIIAYGRMLGVPTPVNEVLYNLVKALEQQSILMT